MLLDYLKNKTIYSNKYKTHSEAVIVACYFNPENSPYRLKAFNTFYESIKHLNHSIVECVIGDSKPQLDVTKNIQRIYTENLLWHKESLLNNLILDLPKKYKYVFWVDADVIFTNKNWLIDSVNSLQTNNIVQPFEYCAHLEKDELTPSFDMSVATSYIQPNYRNKNVWRSFCANQATDYVNKISEDYNIHGHVGFAWGARREVFDQVLLYDKALIGGADHIMAHAAAGQINHKCITKAFSDNVDEIETWSRFFYSVIRGHIGYAPGNLYHIWHGDIAKRQYFKRIKDFTPATKEITERDSNGLFITKNGDSKYIKNYFKDREVQPTDDYVDESDDLLDTIAVAYAVDSILDFSPSFSDAVIDTPQGGEFGGGESGGGGATSSFDEEQPFS